MKFTIFKVGRSFPAVSLTGRRCALSCIHCNGRYLVHMKDGSTPEKLSNVLEDIRKEGGVGALLSGGFDANGSLRISSGTVEVVKEFVEGTGLKINMHTGMQDERTFELLQKAGVDTVSLDLLPEEAARNVYGLDYSLKDYVSNMEMAASAGLRVVPHLTVGLPGVGPQLVERLPPMPSGRIVVNCLVGRSPVKEAERKAATIETVRVVLASGKAEDAVAGCMRPKGDLDFEVGLFKAGASGIVNPHKKLAGLLERKCDIEVRDYCCAL